MPWPLRTTPAQPSPRHRARVRHYWLVQLIALGLVSLIAGLSAALATAYNHLNDALETYQTDKQLTNRPTPRGSTAPTYDTRDPFGGRSINLLIVGSDSRDGLNDSISHNADVSGMRSDSTIIAHISADRSKATLASIPRDTLVDIPACKMSNGVTTSPEHAKFNAAFAIGAEAGANIGDAAACTQQTVESVTGIRIDAWIAVDFAGFVDMVNALGGVRLCVDTDMKSSDAKLDIKAGCHKLKGKTALAYARARTGQGMPEGSDLARIVRQQKLMAAILQRVVSTNLLTSLPDLYHFAQAAINAVATSDALNSVQALAGLAFALRAIPLQQVEFAAVPYADAGDGENVVLAADAEEFFDAMAEDRPVADATPALESPSPGPSPTDQADADDTTSLVGSPGN